MSASLAFKGQLCDPSFTPHTVTPADPKVYDQRARARQVANMPWHKYEYLKFRYGDAVDKTLRALRDGPNPENARGS